MIPPAVVRLIIYYLTTYMSKSIEYIKDKGISQSFTVVKTTIYSIFDINTIYSKYKKNKENRLVQNIKTRALIKNMAKSIIKNASCVGILHSIKVAKTLSSNSTKKIPENVKKEFNNHKTQYSKNNTVIEVIVDIDLVNQIIEGNAELKKIKNNVIQQNKTEYFGSTVSNYYFFIIIERTIETDESNIIGISYCRRDYIENVYGKHYIVINKFNNKSLKNIDDTEIMKKIKSYFGSDELPVVLDFKNFFILYMKEFIKKPFKITGFL